MLVYIRALQIFLGGPKRQLLLCSVILILMLLFTILLFIDPQLQEIPKSPYIFFDDGFSWFIYCVDLGVFQLYQWYCVCYRTLNRHSVQWCT